MLLAEEMKAFIRLWLLFFSTQSNFGTLDVYYFYHDILPRMPFCFQSIKPSTQHKSSKNGILAFRLLSQKIFTNWSIFNQKMASCELALWPLNMEKKFWMMTRPWENCGTGFYCGHNYHAIICSVYTTNQMWGYRYNYHSCYLESANMAFQLLHCRWKNLTSPSDAHTN